MRPLMFLAHRPTPAAIERFLDASRDLPLSYDPVGLALSSDPGLVGSAPKGFSVDTATAVVGRGGSAFASARSALKAWKQFDLGWVSLFPTTAPLDPGTTVAVVARHVGFWSINGCRVVYRLGADTGPEFGFGYGTLTNHAEAGEEIFRLTYDGASGEVTYAIRAVSRPRAVLARLGYPVTRAFQARFRRDSPAALARAVAALRGGR